MKSHPRFEPAPLRDGVVTKASCRSPHVSGDHLPVIHTLALIFAWYASNLGLVLLNKALLTTFHFKFPFLLTLYHMIMTALLSMLLNMAKIMPAQFVRSWKQLSKIAVLSTAFCFTILLGNISLRYIPVSFNQAIGATTPLFTAVLAFVIQRKRETLWTYLALIPVMGGITMTIRYEPKFSLYGFIVCVAATGLRAFKSVVQGVLLTEGEKMSSMSLLMHMAPLSVALLVPLTIFNEPGAFTQSLALMLKSSSFTGLLLLNCMLAYFVNLFNFLVTRYCGALTLQVLGNGKGIIAAILSVLLFKNHVTVLGWVGYSITVAGVIAYSESKKLGSNGYKAVSDSLPSIRSPLHEK